MKVTLGRSVNLIIFLEFPMYLWRTSILARLSQRYKRQKCLLLRDDWNAHVNCKICPILILRMTFSSQRSQHRRPWRVFDAVEPCTTAWPTTRTSCHFARARSSSWRTSRPTTTIGWRARWNERRNDGACFRLASYTCCRINIR